MDYVSYQSNDYKNFENIINKFIIISNNIKSNFIDQANDEIFFKKSYYIPDINITETYNVIKKICIDNGGFYCFSERQKR